MNSSCSSARNQFAYNNNLMLQLVVFFYLKCLNCVSLSRSRLISEHFCRILFFLSQKKNYDFISTSSESHALSFDCNLNRFHLHFEKVKESIDISHAIFSFSRTPFSTCSMCTEVCA